MSNKIFDDININRALALEIFHFDDWVNNIDWLCKQALLSDNSKEKLRLYTLAANLCEKFHSYFHFEQSFFHLIYAEKLWELGEIEQAIKQYEQAIFQDHLNQVAHIKLLEGYQKLELEEKFNRQLYYAQQMRVDISTNPNEIQYQRPFTSFIDYLKFATNSKFLTQDLADEQFKIVSQYDYYLANNIIPQKVDNLWLGWLKFNLTNELVELNNIILLTKKSHELYHQNSAKIYYNRALVYEKLGEIALSNNDIIKAENLWKKAP